MNFYLFSALNTDLTLENPGNPVKNFLTFCCTPSRAPCQRVLLSLSLHGSCAFL